eukprot:scaffold306_cov67-Cylindrotheca_fusiformis.AAC.4
MTISQIPVRFRRKRGQLPPPGDIDLRQSFLVEAAEYYAKSDRITDEPRTSNYGVRVPRNGRNQEDRRRDGDSQWKHAIGRKGSVSNLQLKSMKTISMYQEIFGNLVFDVKMDEIRKKRANKYTDDHKMAFLASVTVAALNGLDVQQGADVQNVRLNASNGERGWMGARPEFGDDEEKLKSAGSFRTLLARKLDGLRFILTQLNRMCEDFRPQGQMIQSTISTS